MTRLFGSTTFQSAFSPSSGGSTAQPADPELGAIADVAGTGLIAITGAGAAAARTLTAGSTKLSISNPGGVAGNPSLDVVEANLSLQNLGGAVTNAQVPETITLDNINQITTRPHSALSGVGTNTHDQIDTALAAIDADITTLETDVAAVESDLAAHIADTANPHAVTKAQVGLGNVTNVAQLSAADIGVTVQAYDVNLTELAAIGTALQQPRVNAGGNAIEYFTPAASGVGGSGTANFIAKFTASTTIADSGMREVSGSFGINMAAPLAKLHVSHATSIASAGQFETGNGASDSGLPSDVSIPTLRVGGKSYFNSRYIGIIGFGYQDNSIPAATIAYFTTDGSGNLKGELRFATRDSTGNVVPTTRFTIAPDGTCTFTEKIQTAASTSGRAGLNLPAGTSPSSPVEGDIWLQSGLKALHARVDGINQILVGLIFSHRNTTEVGASSTSEVSLFSTGITSGNKVLPANFWVTNKIIRVRVQGIMDMQAAETVTFRADFSGTDHLSVAVTNVGAITASKFDLTFDIICNATGSGSSGNLVTVGDFSYYDSNGLKTYLPVNNGGAGVAIDTTLSRTLDITIQFTGSNAANGVTVLMITGEVLD